MPIKWTFGKHLVASCAIIGMALFSQWLLGLLTRAAILHAMNQNSNVAIIGGADGPTSIFVTGGGAIGGSGALSLVLLLVLLIASYVPLRLIANAWGKRHGKPESGSR